MIKLPEYPKCVTGVFPTAVVYDSLIRLMSTCRRRSGVVHADGAYRLGGRTGAGVQVLFTIMLHMTSGSCTLRTCRPESPALHTWRQNAAGRSPAPTRLPYLVLAGIDTDVINASLELRVAPGALPTAALKQQSGATTASLCTLQACRPSTHAQQHRGLLISCQCGKHLCG
jgi:hypothetical protein